MQIINKKPPIFDEAHKHFDIDDSATIYTWGDIIYNPAGIRIAQELVEHESIHSRQQEEIGGPELWWKKYFEDPVFRANQEAEAYGAQYAYYCNFCNRDRNYQTRYLYRLAQILSSDMYKVSMSHSDAIKAIKAKVK